LFVNNRHQLYKALDRDAKEEQEAPDADVAVGFWTNIWTNEQTQSGETGCRMFQGKIILRSMLILRSMFKRLKHSLKGSRTGITLALIRYRAFGLKIL